MKVAIADILGLKGVPSHRTSAAAWFERNGITVHGERKQGVRQTVNFADLPASLYCAVKARVYGNHGLQPGTYDDQAHHAFDNLAKSVQNKAERRAEIARFTICHGDNGLSVDTLKAVRAKFGDKGTSEPSLRRIMATVEGVDPINWAPALAPKYKGRTAKAETSVEAWRWFLSLLSVAAPEWPLKEAWKRTKAKAEPEGWDWPSYATVTRRWNDMTKRERLIIRHGAEKADELLYQPIRRDPTTIKALEYVSLDGRTLDLWADFGDGKPRRPVMLALVDCASGKVLDFLFSQSENADRTRDVIINTCETYGAFDNLYTDNGSAFAGHVIAGRVKHKFRNGKNRDLVRERPGVCAQLGIGITFALPGHGQSKIAERKFRDFSRQIDDGPEFHGAHAGHKPGATLSPGIVPVPIATVEAVYKREVAAYNSQAKRRSAACGGKLSYDEAFAVGMEERVRRTLTRRQIELALLDYKAVTVDQRGQFRVLGWVYGSLHTQDALLKYEGRKIFAGFVPGDLSKPVVAYDPDDERLICEGIPAIEKGEYNSKAGKELAAKGRAEARKYTRKAEESLELVRQADVTAELAIRPANAMPDPDALEAPSTVVRGTFNAPIKTGSAPAAKASKPDSCAVSPDEWEEMSQKILASHKAGKANVRG